MTDKPKSEEELEAQQRRMVQHQLVPRGITDRATLLAVREVPRHRFVSAEFIDQAYEDHPLPIGEGQTISQPFMVALMVQLARIQPTDRVLEIGTGSGYGAAVLSRIAQQVVTVERLSLLAEKAQKILQQLGYSNVTVVTGDGTQGYAPQAPYNVIIVTAGAPTVPETLKAQLAVGGRLIIPVGDTLSQDLLCFYKKSDQEYTQTVYEAVRFVPLIGQEGW